MELFNCNFHLLSSVLELEQRQNAIFDEPESIMATGTSLILTYKQKIAFYKSCCSEERLHQYNQYAPYEWPINLVIQATSIVRQAAELVLRKLSLKSMGRTTYEFKFRLLGKSTLIYGI